MENVSSEGLKNVAKLLNDYYNATVKSIYCGMPGGGYQGIADAIQSEDSNLADSCRDTFAIFEKYMNKFRELINKAKESIDQYAEATLANEQATQTNVDSVNDSLNSISTSLDDINF